MIYSAETRADVLFETAHCTAYVLSQTPSSSEIYFKIKHFKIQGAYKLSEDFVTP